jgi:hypothetical protein
VVWGFRGNLHRYQPGVLCKIATWDRLERRETFLRWQPPEVEACKSLYLFGTGRPSGRQMFHLGEQCFTPSAKLGSPALPALDPEGCPATAPSLGWLAVNAVEAVLIWMMLLTPQQPLRLFPKRFAHVGDHYAHLLDCLLKLLRGASKLICPISEFVFLVNIDPVAVSVIAPVDLRIPACRGSLELD